MLVLLDDDLDVSPKLWAWLSSLKSNEFAMCNVKGHLSTRVFAIHAYAFERIRFDDSIKYIFEDGDFALRVQSWGCRLRIVPSTLYSHIEHKRKRYRNIAALNWEYCRMLVKYKRHVYRNLFEFFWRPFDYRIKFQDLVTKIPFTFFWILRSLA